MTNIKQQQQKGEVIGVTKGIPSQIGKKAVNILMSAGSYTSQFQVNSRYTSLELAVQIGALMAYPIAKFPNSHPERAGSMENKKEQSGTPRLKARA